MGLLVEGRLDGRFSEAGVPATPWDDVTEVLRDAELYWLTTSRTDGRPHVTPLVGVWHGGAVHFCTGPGEQKAANLRADARVAVITGCNRWNEGLDVAVEGRAVRVTDDEVLSGVADVYRAKYGGEWNFSVGDGVFDPDGQAAHVFRVEAAKVLAFAKAPHAQTTFRF